MRLEHWFYTVPLRLSSLFRRWKVEQELDEELQYHMKQKTEENIARGLTPEEARYAAVRAMEGLDQQKERSRDMRRVTGIEHLIQDFRYGLRMLAKSPGFTVVAVLTLALGIGANSAVFSIVNTVLLRPLPLPHGERVASIQVTPALAGDTTGPASLVQFNAWRVNNTKFEMLAAVRGLRGQISGKEAPEEIHLLQVSHEFQELAGLRPYLGRGFLEDDFRSGAPNVCLISYRLWLRRFSADRSIVGRVLHLDSESSVIIGVLPRDSTFPDAENDLWTVLHLGLDHQTQRNLDVYGRLTSGISAQDAEAWLAEVTVRAESELPDWLRTRRVTVTPIREQLVSDERTLLLTLSGIAACVLLICCANMSNLLLARHSNREREMALRASLGATRGRLIRQLLTEALILCGAGTAAGFVAGRALVSMSHNLLSDSRFNGLITTGYLVVDARIIAFTLLLSILTTMLFGLVPSLHFTRADLSEALKCAPRGQARGRGRSHISRYLIAMELAIAFILLTGTGLLVRSFAGLLSEDRGFTEDHLLTVRLPIPSGISVTPTRRKQVFRNLIEELERMPYVTSVGITTSLPLGGLNARMTLQRPGQPLDPDSLPWVGINCVNPDYFKSMGIRLVRGRTFDSGDDENGMRVAIVNETLQRQFWPGREVIGQEIMAGVRIVGTVNDIRQEALDTRQGPTFYLPFEQRDGLAAAPNFLLVRTKGDPKAFIPTLKEVVGFVDHLQPLVDIRTMEEVLSRSVMQRRLLTALMTGFAGLAVVLSIVGIYGVLSYLVANRTREIGIRMCLGARPSEVLILLTKQLSCPVVAGLLVGLTVSLVTAGVLSRWLFAIRPNDPMTLIIAAIVTAAAALLGGVVPALRALHVDLMSAVRME